MSYCRHCGTEIDDSAVFCPKCGERVSPSSAEHTDGDAVRETSAKSAAPVKNTNWKAIAIAAIAVALIAVGGLVLSLVLNGTGSSGDGAMNGGNAANSDETEMAYLEGAYEDNYGLFGIIQFNKDGTIYYYYESWVTDDYEVLIGEYKIGENGTVYITGLESDLASMFPVLKYDEAVDVFTCTIEGTDVLFTRVDVDLPQPDGSASQSQEDTAGEQPEQAKNDNNPSVKPEPAKSDEFTGPAKVMDDYLGNPVQAGWASDSSYLWKVAESDEYIYWHWAAGGGFGVKKQEAAYPYTVVEGDGSPAADRLLMLALYREEYYDSFRFKSITYAGSGEVFYNGETIPAEQWLFISEDGEIRNYAAISATVNSQFGFGEITTTAFFLNGEPWVYYDEDTFVRFY